MTEDRYVVATIRPWNIAEYRSRISKLPGTWSLVTRPEDLTLARLSRLQPKYVFFPHWSHLVPKSIIERYECVCFHETDLPYGRGGSPIQNLIARGHKKTVVTALQMIEELDAGPVYAKRPLSLHGRADEIYARSAAIVREMIEEIIVRKSKPRPQKGKPTIFKRRTPQQSRIPKKCGSLTHLFDHLRMLDAEEYPRAFLEYGDLRIEFSRAALRTGRIDANVVITTSSKQRRAR